MMRPSRDAIQSYMSITGADESLAIQTLEEHGNNLTEAINSHFRDVERSILDPSSDSRRPQYNAVEDNSHVRPQYNAVEDNSRRTSISPLCRSLF
ncbi:plant UBX domain-containing protein 9 [Raphanus sativus]|uniref:Plant UBX domain-containing protein 9 n=1 Tax=Raphanus sativus TaxID=3726 RepID=A0A6J0MPN6_RAPSA|nr:plant UBX domain-containing protein 9 [Raphanus sativus]